MAKTLSERQSVAETELVETKLEIEKVRLALMRHDLEAFPPRVGCGVPVGADNCVAVAAPPEADNPDDPWAHRSKGMRCGTCMWFVEKRTHAMQQVGHLIGRCRRHAPTMNGYPVVFSDDFCGDHKLDETK